MFIEIDGVLEPVRTFYESGVNGYIIPLYQNELLYSRLQIIVPEHILRSVQIQTNSLNLHKLIPVIREN